MLCIPNSKPFELKFFDDNGNNLHIFFEAYFQVSYGEVTVILKSPQFNMLVDLSNSKVETNGSYLFEKNTSQIIFEVKLLAKYLEIPLSLI
jgi:hypothetical protein